MNVKSLIFALAALAVMSLRASGEPALDDKPMPNDDPKAVELFKACVRGDLEAVKQSVNSGAPVDGRVGVSEHTPLIAAAANQHADVVDFLIASKVKLDAADAYGATPLIHSVYQKDSPDIALKLIAAGADVNIAGKYGQDALMYASERGNDKVVQAMIGHKVDLNGNCEQGPAICWAAWNDHTSTVKLLIDAGANVGLLPSSSRSRYSALGCAAAKGNLEMVNLLLAAKADPNEHDTTGATPLMAAAEWRHDECVGRLIEVGADLNAKDNDGNTVLIEASKRGDQSMIRLLLDKGADPNIADPRGETALTIGGERGNVEIVDLLKDKGAKRTDIHIIVKADPISPITPAREWTLAVGAIYTQRAGLNTKTLGSGEGIDGAKEMLSRDWRITDKDSMMTAIDNLVTAGHRSVLQRDGARYAAMSDEQFEALIATQPDKALTLKTTRACYQKWKEKMGLAWDMCRAANIVNSAYAGKFLTKDEAWAQLLRIAKVTQPAFSSWQEMSDNFLDAREIWTHGRDPHFEACSKVLLNSADPNSPWTLNPWNTSLAEN